MKADDPYFKTEVSNIPVSNLEEILKKEILSLMFDFGQKVAEDEFEFKYLAKHSVECLREYYPKWKLSYVGECFRRGKLDEFDKGMKITMKRLEYWFKVYNIVSMANMRKDTKDDCYTSDDLKRLAENGERFPNIILFRQSRELQFDGDEWTLVKIEETEDYQKWLTLGYRKPSMSDVIRKLKHSIV